MDGSVEKLAQFSQERLRTERFLQELLSGLERRNRSTGKVAGGEENANLRVPGLDLGGKLGTVHARHDHVGEHELHLAVVVLEHLQRETTVPGFEAVAASPAGRSVTSRYEVSPTPGLSLESAVFPAVSGLSHRHPPLLLPGCGGPAPCGIVAHDDSSPT